VRVHDDDEEEVGDHVCVSGDGSSVWACRGRRGEGSGDRASLLPLLLDVERCEAGETETDVAVAGAVEVAVDVEVVAGVALERGLPLLVVAADCRRSQSRRCASTSLASLTSGRAPAQAPTPAPAPTPTPAPAPVLVAPRPEPEPASALDFALVLAVSAGDGRVGLLSLTMALSASP
jgi:hypothetical protein